MIPKSQLESIAGAANVLDDQATLEAYSRDISFVNPVRPACVVRASQAAHIQAIVRLANETGTPLVPVSSGSPHFRGDTIPGVGGAVVVDMSGMKQIPVVDRARRVAMCEPGVTFAELLPRVREAGLRLNMPLLPRQSKSVAGSVLEREPVIMPCYQWDISDPLACAGVYFGTGDEFRTGQAAGPGDIEEQWAVGGVQKAPYGPGTASLHRLLQGAQGTMGIVTWISMRCEILPGVESPFLAGSADLEPLLEMAYWLIRKRMVNECFILNDTNLATIFGPDAADYRKVKAGLPAWNLFYTVAGYEYFPEERVAAHVRDITEISQRLCVEPCREKGGISATEILRAVHEPCADPYWKLRPRGGSHDVMYLTGREQLAGQIDTMHALAERAGYASDVGAYIQPSVQGTNWHCEFSLFYNPAIDRERARVRDLSTAAVATLINQGAFFSRPYGADAGFILNRDAASVEVLHTFKKIFDPNRVMNPGKVCF